jgi:DNA ligase-associated metallophosphoesterase
LHRAKICTVHSEVSINFGGETLTLSTLRTAFHSASSTLIISDLHLGKTTHFRNNALPIPKQALVADFRNLETALNHFAPRRVCFLGDLFHSTWNEEWTLFIRLMQDFAGISKELIAGNHDILHPDKYAEADMVVLNKQEINGLTLLHETTDQNNEFCISGHIHPGFKIKGKGRQSMVLPCFYLGQRQLIMPAFGSLTGKMPMKKVHENDEVWCFFENRFYPC